MFFIGLIFGVFSAKGVQETFGDAKWRFRWLPSDARKGSAFRGEFFRQKPRVFEHLDDDSYYGLKTQGFRKYFQFSRSFPPFSSESEVLHLQFEVLLEDPQSCGQNFLKVGPPLEVPTEYGGHDAYWIQFGPERCGDSQKTSLILNNRDQYMMKTQDLAYQQVPGLTSLYALEIHPNCTARVKINNVLEFEGEIADNWRLNPIDPPPANFVEPIEEVEDELVEYVRDPFFQEPPVDWDVASDGPWQVPFVATAISAPQPAADTEESEEITEGSPETPELQCGFSEIGYLGFDIWQVETGSIFDNIVVTLDPQEAQFFVDKWKNKRIIEEVAWTPKRWGAHLNPSPMNTSRVSEPLPDPPFEKPHWWDFDYV